MCFTIYLIKLNGKIDAAKLTNLNNNNRKCNLVIMIYEHEIKDNEWAKMLLRMWVVGRGSR